MHPRTFPTIALLFLSMAVLAPVAAADVVVSTPVEARLCWDQRPTSTPPLGTPAWMVNHVSDSLPLAPGVVKIGPHDNCTLIVSPPEGGAGGSVVHPLACLGNHWRLFYVPGECPVEGLP